MFTGRSLGFYFACKSPDQHLNEKREAVGEEHQLRLNKFISSGKLVKGLGIISDADKKTSKSQCHNTTLQSQSQSQLSQSTGPKIFGLPYLGGLGFFD